MNPLKLENRRLFFSYTIISFCILVIFSITRYFEVDALNSDLILGGWDAPFYAWHARYAILEGPIYLMQRLGYPYLYTQLVAFFGWIFGNFVIVQKILPVIMGLILISLYQIISFKISKNIHIAGLTALLAPISVGTIRLVGEYNRNLMAFLLSLVIFFLISKANNTNEKRFYFYIFAILFVMSATQFETFGITVLVLSLFYLLRKNLRKLLYLLLLSLSVIGLLVSLFPDFLSRYYFSLMPQSYSLTSTYGFFDFTFWTVGSVYLLPLLFLGLYLLFYKYRLKKNNVFPLLLFALSVFLLGISFILLVISQFSSNPVFGVFGIRSLLILPTPILLGLAISYICKLIQKVKVKVNLDYSKRILTFYYNNRKNPNKTVKIISVLFVIIIFMSLFWTTNIARTTTSGPYLQISGYFKLKQASQYLSENNLHEPIFLFHGSSVWSTDYYRAYIGIEIGEHLAYYGSLDNLIKFRPTYPDFLSVEKELAAFESEKYLQDLMENSNYTIYPQKVYVSNLYELRSHPLVYVIPELYDALIPFYIKEFEVEDGIFIVPSFSMIENIVSPIFKLETENGNSEVTGELNDDSIEVNISGVSGSWFRLTGFSSNYYYTRIEQNGLPDYPEKNPRRLDGSIAKIGNDPADDTQNWKAPESNSELQLNRLSSDKMEGNYSLSATGNIDFWKTISIVYDPPFLMNLSQYDVLSFWGKNNKTDAIWALTLWDNNGHKSTYWGIDTVNQTDENKMKDWRRIVTKINEPSEIQAEFDYQNIESIGFGLFSGSSEEVINFSIDDVIVDNSLDETEVFKSRISANDNVKVFFNGF